jgi:hypothetical protein
MLSVGSRESRNLDALNEWMAAQVPEHGDLNRLRLLNKSVWGGTKWPDALYGAALNHWNLRALVDRVAETPWIEPHLVQLFVSDEWDFTFGVWMFHQNEFVEVLPPRDTGGEGSREPFNLAWDARHSN